MTLEPESERQRLARLYAGMADGELEGIAEDCASLSVESIEALAAELRKRGLNIPLSHPAEHELSVEQQPLVIIRKFRDLPDALLAKGCLDSAGIESFLGDDNMVRTDWFISNLLGGIKLRVKPEDAEAATALLDQPIPETFDVEGVGEYKQPHCPKCQSAEISFEHFDKTVLYTTAFFGLPVPVPRNIWKCGACGHEWRDTARSEG